MSAYCARRSASSSRADASPCRTKEIDPALARDAELWAGCIAGALHESEYRALLAAAGFEAVEIEETRVHEIADGAFISAFVRARRPA